MSEHHAHLHWERTTPDFQYPSYNRDHQITFKQDQTVPFSASPTYKGNPALVDPEDALVAALSSCHMLSFLAIACKRKFTVDEYRDQALGVLEKNAHGQLAITRVTLRPEVFFSGTQPDAATYQAMHDESHHACFIANSVKTEVTVEPVRARAMA
jgi:organic hydroperoxide reductase OsmC/OhrA